MEIKKVLMIESAVHLYRVLDNCSYHLELLEGDDALRIQYYQDLATEFLYGCKCEEDINWQRLSTEYDNLRSDSALVSAVCKVLECDRIDFK